ncbi:MAG: hypothetical protein JJP05_02675 [cyanobacterium endosymbiont of Rhopalodia gibba]
MHQCNLERIYIYFFFGVLLVFIYKSFFDLFSLSILKRAMTSRLVYFNFTILKTLGCGDITPTNSFSRTLTNVEVLVGINMSCCCYY